MFGRKKKQEPQDPVTPDNQGINPQVLRAQHKKEEKETRRINKTFYEKIEKAKKEILKGKGVTKAELEKELSKYYDGGKRSSPFETRADKYFVKHDYGINPAGRITPYEKVVFKGRTYYIDKKFEDGEIKINHSMPEPELDTNPKEEYRRIKEIKKEMNDINSLLFEIREGQRIGDKKYNYIDIHDLNLSYYNLERVYQSIKYGSENIMSFPHPNYPEARVYWIRRSNNGQYKYLKVTENNYIVDEHQARQEHSQKINREIGEIANLRLKNNFKNIIISFLIMIILVSFVFSNYKLTTFEQEYVSSEVDKMCGKHQHFFNEFIDKMLPICPQIAGIEVFNPMTNQTESIKQHTAVNQARNYG